MSVFKAFKKSKNGVKNGAVFNSDPPKDAYGNVAKAIVNGYKEEEKAETGVAPPSNRPDTKKMVNGTSATAVAPSSGKTNRLKTVHEAPTTSATSNGPCYFDTRTARVRTPKQTIIPTSQTKATTQTLRQPTVQKQRPSTQPMVNGVAGMNGHSSRRTSNAGGATVHFMEPPQGRAAHSLSRSQSLAAADLNRRPVGAYAPRRPPDRFGLRPPVDPRVGMPPPYPGFVRGGVVRMSAYSQQPPIPYGTLQRAHAPGYYKSVPDNLHQFHPTMVLAPRPRKKILKNHTTLV